MSLKGQNNEVAQLTEYHFDITIQMSDEEHKPSFFLH